MQNKQDKLSLKYNMEKKAFSFVELIVVLAILIILAIIGINMLNSNKQKVNNTKVEAGIKTISNGLFAYLQENRSLPNPGGNNNYFKADSSYSHSGASESFGVYGSITEDTLPKKYLDTLPLDPVSNHYYSYGKTLDNKYFEVASIVRSDDSAETRLDGTYPGEYGPISLIREYNGPFFVSDKNTEHLPYNPDEHIITAKIGDIVGSVSVNGLNITGTKQLKKGDQIISGVSSSANIYFSDGSMSSLLSNSELTLTEMDYKNTEDNLLTRVKLYLGEGSIFSKVTSLNNGSDFEIYTSDTTAAVRGTIFFVESDSVDTNVVVIKGSVEVYETPTIEGGTKPTKLEKSAPIKIINEGNSADIKDNNAPETPYNEAQIEDLIDDNDKIVAVAINLPEGKTLEEIKNGSDKDIKQAGNHKKCILGTNTYNGYKNGNNEDVVEILEGNEVILTKKETKINGEKIYTKVVKCNNDETINVIRQSDTIKCISNEYHRVPGKEECDNNNQTNGIYSREYKDGKWKKWKYKGIFSGTGIIDNLNLNGDFEIKIKVNQIPTEKKYLLHGGFKFQLFFQPPPPPPPGVYTKEATIPKICFQISLGTTECKEIDEKKKKINIKREDNKIYLQGELLEQEVSGNIDSFNVGFTLFPGSPPTPAFVMNSGNEIELDISK